MSAAAAAAAAFCRPGSHACLGTRLPACNHCPAVQGVFFRAHTVDRAKSLGLVGYVMNTAQVHCAVPLRASLWGLISVSLLQQHAACGTGSMEAGWMLCYHVALPSCCCGSMRHAAQATWKQTGCCAIWSTLPAQPPTWGASCRAATPPPSWLAGHREGRGAGAARGG